MQIAHLIIKLLEDCHRMADTLGLTNDVNAAKAALKNVETEEDLYQIYRTDVPIGQMSIRNLIAVLTDGLNDMHTSSEHCLRRIQMTLDSPYVVSMHKRMADKKKGSTEICLYKPSANASDLEKSLEEFGSTMGDNIKPKIEIALKKGKGARCEKLMGIAKPIIGNAKKTYSPAQIAAAKKLMLNIRSV
jgi:hypothetical protein